MDTHPAEQIGRVGAGGCKKPAAGVSATQRCRREQPTDQCIAVAHRPQQQSRGRCRLVGIAPEPVRTDGVDEERDARGQSDAARESAARSIDMARSLGANRPTGHRTKSKGPLMCGPLLATRSDGDATCRYAERVLMASTCRSRLPAGLRACCVYSPGI
jgi:hypothetical protein